MKKNENSIYDIVDENFMSNFSGKHIGFMKDYYYKVYYNFCRHIKKKILPQEVFFTNMRRRKKNYSNYVVHIVDMWLLFLYKER